MRSSSDKKPDIRSEIVRQLSSAVRFKDISGGLHLAEKYREMMTDRNDPRTGQFRRLEAELFYQANEYEKALASARIAASLLEPLGETAELAEAFLLTGNALVSLGNNGEAETAFLDAESLFRRTDNTAGRISAANELARVYFNRSEYRSALKYLLDAVKLSDRHGERRRTSFIWGNIGRVYTFLGNFKKAIEALQLNVDISHEIGDDKEKAKALIALGYVEMQSEQYEKAEERFKLAYPLLVKEKLRREAVIYMTSYGELKTRCGEYNIARRFLNEAVEEARKLAPESSLLVSPMRHLAELELAAGKLTAASRLANKTLALVDKVGELVEKGAVIRILARIEIAFNESSNRNRQKAIDLFAQALSIFEEIDARFERADTLVIMSTCGLGSPRRRLANLFRAHDLYKQMGIRPKYEKTQDLINRAESPRTMANSASDESRRPTREFITANPHLKKVIVQLSQAAKSGLPVLLMGETGTGKDLLAERFHAETDRKGKLVPVNCAAFPDTLLEAELFGYRKGAFTGAVSDKQGLLHRANGGTFFLDEVGELSLSSQAKLLTVIETGRARRLGDTVEEELDIRFIAATNCDLMAMVEEGTFRRDLYYRLSGIQFRIPPLSERPEDIPLLVHYFLKKEGVLGEDDPIDAPLIAEFSSRSWPGNVRQLESEVRKLTLFSTIAREDSLSDLAGVLIQNDSDSQTISLFNQVEQFEQALIRKALRQSNGNKSQAARLLSIHESTLRAKMKRYNIDLAAAS
jgi:transcriptional regulator with PAS, ATPase and Fis domain